MSTADRPAPHEDESLPPALREALRIMSKRGRVVELTGRSVIDGLSAQPATPAAVDIERQERYAAALHDAVEADLSLNDQEPGIQALYARMAEAAMALADNEQRGDIPAWEAVYEPGNVSDYLIGYANDQDAATGMAEAWMRSQAEVTGRLEWEPWGTVTPMPSGYDQWFELVERHDDGVDTGPGIVVRRRLTDAPAADRTAEPDSGWRGATEIVPDREVQRLAATGLVGYQQDRGRLLHCLYHKPAPASRYVDFQEVTADDLPDGGICVHRSCGADLLAVLPAAAGRAAVLRDAADRLDADMERFFAEWPDEPRNSPYALGRRDAAAELRSLADGPAADLAAVVAARADGIMPGPRRDAAGEAS